MAKILIIEDNLDIRENIAEILELDGYETSVASNGKEGARVAINELPDLILCDIMMPELDGYGVLHVLSKNEATLAIPFIFLTAKAEPLDVRKGMNLGADDYITKPFDETDLLTTIQNRLRKYNHQHIPAIPNHDTSFKVIFNQKQVKHFKTRDIVYSEGDSSSFIYFVKEGKVKITKINEAGKEVVLELCSNDDFFGYWPSLQDSFHTNTAECLSDSEIWMIPSNEFKKLIAENSNVSSAFIKMLSKNLLIKEHKILDLAYESVRKRIANALIELKQAYSDHETFQMKVSRETIASMAGTSIETAIRMLSEFKADGLIEINGSEIKLLDPARLSKMPY